jgi:two-component system LytT family response regulator
MGLSCLIIERDLNTISKISFLLGKYVPHWTIFGVASSLEKSNEFINELHNIQVIFLGYFSDKNPVLEVLPEFKDFKGKIICIKQTENIDPKESQLMAGDCHTTPIYDTTLLQTIQLYSKENVRNYRFDFQDDMVKSMEKYLKQKKIAFNTPNGYVIKQLDEILYAKANNNYTEFYFANQEKIIAAKTMLEYEKLLSDLGFVRIHQSYLANFKHISRFDNECLQLFMGDVVLPVSNRKKSHLLEMLRSIF